jgi:thiol-disulfide isomerase/thioredoxin
MTRARIAGLALVALVLGASIHDASLGVMRFDRLAPLGPGGDVPEFRVAMVDGEPFGNADLVGKVHVVTFWATWCHYCRDELDELDGLAASYDPERLSIVAVNREGGDLSLAQATALARRYRDVKRLDYAVAVDDGKMARAFGVGPIPHTAIFDRTGRLRHVHQGRVSGDTIASEIDALLAE